MVNVGIAVKIKIIQNILGVVIVNMNSPKLRMDTINKKYPNICFKDI